ncbi:MAG: apolipoprotein N-acyltransferase [Cryobacterium sp.]|nr:apolipoprotein N-acyltransferase [Cryobacterium sp.]
MKRELRSVKARAFTSDIRTPLPASLITAAIAGLVLSLAFPKYGLWPLVILGTGLMFWSIRGRSIPGSFFVGLIGGFSFWGTHIFWLTIYLGPIPWLALAGLQTLFFAIGTVLIGLAWKFVPRVWPSTFGQLWMLPLLLAAIWTLREAVTSVWPYGGFSWGRLAFSQSDSPISGVVAWIGITGLSFVIAWISAFATQIVRLWRRFAGVGTLALVAASALLAVIPPFQSPVVGSLTVAAVQGNSDAGLFAQRFPGETLNEHLAQTIKLFGRKIDLLVWPENASDLNPLKYPQAAEALDYVTKQLNAPLVTGTITGNAKGETFNSLLLWEPGKGAVAQYDKIHPVPFAEYLPDRSFWYPFAPKLFDMVPRDYTIGTRSNVFDINNVPAGLAICFDIVDDSLIKQMINSGAEIILAPTNNADFGHTDENVQQLAIARLRAIETDRYLVQVSTVGVSAVVAPDGRIVDSLPIYTAGSMVDKVSLHSFVTVAMVLSPYTGFTIGGFAIAELILVYLVLARRRDRLSSLAGKSAHSKTRES